MTQTHVHTPHALSSPLEDHVNPPSPSYINYPSTLPENLAPSPSINEDKSTKYIVAAVVQSIVAGFSLVAMFFLCCFETRRNKIEPKETQKNENPPVGFCTSPGSVSASRLSDDNAGLSEKIYGNLPLPPGRTAPSLPAAPAPPPPKPPAPPPPPPPKAGRYPNSRPTKPSSLRPDCGRGSSAGESNELCDQSEAPKTKLKPFFWDKVVASPDHAMVWHEIEAGSFQFDEAMIENLFGYVQSDKNKNERRKDSLTSDPQIIQIIDARKSHNLAILLRALNVTTDEVCDALNKGNELPAEFIQPLLKMAPTSEEELNLRSYNGDVSHLGPADRFLKAIVNIPFAFKRLESLLFITTFQEEVSSIKETLATLEVACKELRNSRLFLKLLEAILKTGNRMNDGTYRGGAQAFKLDTLLKLSDVKGTDGKTTLLHFVVQEIIRSEGLRAVRQLKESQSLSEDSDYHRTLGLQVISGLSNELEDVKRAALFDNENLKASISKLGRSLENTREFLNNEMKSLEGNNEFHDVLASFVTRAELDVVNLVQEEERITALVKITGDYFYSSREGNDDCSRLFVIVRDFLLMLDKACKDVQNSIKSPSKTTPRNEPSHSQGSSHHESLPYYRKQLFPAMRERQMGDNHSSDDES